MLDKKSSEKVSKLVLLDDEPVLSFKKDGLELLPFAKVIAGTVLGTRGPFTIGVFGDWGHGKTSVLKQAQSLLETYHKDEVIPVWFNAWQYEKEEHPIIPLVSTIVREAEKKLKFWQAEKETGVDAARKKAAAGLTKVTRALRAILYGLSAKASVKIPGFAEIEAGIVDKELIDRYEKLAGESDPLIDRTLYYNAFETLQTVVKEKNSGISFPKIAVLVDDLDRCLPPQALKLLESIKLVLCQPGFIFVLAIDRHIVENYIIKRYKEEFSIDDYERSGARYLDKIIQLPLQLPSHRSRFENYINTLCKGAVLTHDSNQDVKNAIKDLVQVLAIGSDYNPRSLVRFVNNLIVDRSIWETRGDPADSSRLGLCAVSKILLQELETGAIITLLTTKNSAST